MNLEKWSIICETTISFRWENWKKKNYHTHKGPTLLRSQNICCQNVFVFISPENFIWISSAKCKCGEFKIPQQPIFLCLQVFHILQNLLEYFSGCKTFGCCNGNEYLNVTALKRKKRTCKCCKKKKEKNAPAKVAITMEMSFTALFLFLCDSKLLSLARSWRSNMWYSCWTLVVSSKSKSKFL